MRIQQNQFISIASAALAAAATPARPAKSKKHILDASPGIFQDLKLIRPSLPFNPKRAHKKIENLLPRRHGQRVNVSAFRGSSEDLQFAARLKRIRKGDL